ncbi:MAG: hypothetical protein JWO36_7126 [Myxococcales bacterium]|nr:hypothetical protein [Myxococcales bacterium]
MRHMRLYLALLLLASACASSPPSGEPTYSSVRDRLERSPTRLLIGAAGSTGSITARRYTHDGWVDGLTPLATSNGELTAHLDQAGLLELSAFDVGVDPIEIPDSVFGKPAQLRDVRVTLTSRPAAAPQWTDSDDATATIMIDLDLSWSIMVNGGTAPLGAQHLPPIAADLTLTGAGDHIDAKVSLHAMGELWSWAGLMKLSELQMSLAAATVD